MMEYLFSFLWILEILNILNNIVELLFVIGFGHVCWIFNLSERGVVHVDLRVGVHQVLIVHILSRIAHFKMFIE